MLVWRQPFLSAGMAGHGWGFALWIYDNFSRSPTSRTIGDALLLLSTPEEDTEYPFIDKLAVEDRAQPAEIPSLDLTRKEKTITFVFSRRRKGKPGPDNKMHNTNNKCTDDVAIARPVENAKECATSLAVAVNKKGSQVHKSLSIDNRDKAPSSSAIARPKTSGRKKKASKKEKHSTDSAIVPTKGKGDEGSNDGGNPTSSSQVVLYDPRVEECAVDTTLEETGKGRTKRSLPSKDNGKEALPAKRRRTSKNLLPSKDSEAASDKDFLMCQMSIQTIIDAANQLKKIPELIKSVRDAGFGHFIDTKIRGSINHVSDEGTTEEENELAPTGDNTTDEEEETNVVSCHHDEQEQIKIPCFGEGDKDYPVGHYFVMAVNLRRKRFELLDSLGGEGAEQHFVNTAGVFKEIWKEAYKQSKGKLSPKNLDDFSYEKPKVIPLQGDTLNCGVYMIMVLMFWTRKTLFHIRREDILYIRKRLLYLVLMWEKLEVNLDLIETFHKDDLIKINLGEYNLIRKWTTVKPTMTVIVSLPNVNIPEPKEIDDGK
ncbi:hypothetical protein ACQ4PT_009441 [Festuca glaucescens]